MIAGEHAAEAGQTSFGLDRDQRVHAIVRLQFMAPAALGGGAAQAGTANGTNLH
jgi:hypothetical protein